MLVFVKGEKLGGRGFGSAFNFLELCVRFLVGVATAVVDGGLVAFVVLLKNLHETEQVLLCDLIVVLEAIVALKDELLSGVAVLIDEFFETCNVLVHLEVILIFEVKKRRVRKLLGESRAQHRVIVLL